MDAERIENMQRHVEDNISSDSKHQIMQLLGQIDNLSGAEKLLLYLKLPTGPIPVDPLKQPVNPLGSRGEIQQTVMWIQTHLEVDPEISLPKQDVYEEYIDYCTSTKMKPLSTADFGKVMKQVYPCVKPRRLGTRGNSRYCYAGMRKRIKLEVPQLPDLADKTKSMEIPMVQNDLLIAASHLIREWAEKRLGFQFGNLCELAQHLVEKNLVESSSPAAHILSNTISGPTEFSESIDSKSSELRQKVQQRGVIKQLKRKIQAQPQTSVKAPTIKKSKSHDDEMEEVGNLPESDQIPCNSILAQNFSVKTENESTSSDFPSQSSSAIVRSKDYAPNVSEPSPDMTPMPMRQFNPEYPQNTAVNLTQLPTPRMRTPLVMAPMKNTPMRHMGYNDPYDRMYLHDPQPTNLSLNNFVDESTHAQGSSNHNLPINLSNTSADCDSMKSFKTPIIYKEFDSQSTRHEDSLNLSVHRRDTWFASETPNVVVSHAKLPLPGKKMFLESYNANQCNQSNEQNVKPAMHSPSSSGPYLPKKMRATESFGGKLSSARFIESPAVEIPQIEPEKYNKVVAEDFPLQSSTQNLQNAVPNTIVNYEMPKPVCDMKTPVLQAEYTAAAAVTSMHQELLVNEADMLQKAAMQNLKGGQKLYKYNKKPIKTKSPDSTSNFNKSDTTSIQSMPIRAVTRGRPRKKSLSKAKYTRRQPRSGAVNHSQCAHIKYPKRSSDSCSSLTESINIKTGIICAENHSEILNRERVSSICNMDKHALDDYLNEGNSQEHEEELMKYFQPNVADLDSIAKEIKSEKIEPVLVQKHSVDVSSTPGVITTASNIRSSTRVTNLDMNEDHSQGKNEKLSQLREILQKNLNHNIKPTSSIVKSDDVIGCNPGSSTVGFNITGDGNESAFTTITRRKIEEFEYKEGSASASLSMLSKKQQSNATDRPSPVQDSVLVSNSLHIRRRVSFDNHSNEQRLSYSNQGSPIYLKGQHSVPQSPTSRMQHFNFMPISPGRLSPVNSNKNSPVVTTCKRSVSPSKISTSASCTSPGSVSSTASPFVSPRNTPVPRARNSCHEKPTSKLQSKKLAKLGMSKGLYVGVKLQYNNNPILKPVQNELGNFIMPNEQSTVPRSPNFMTKVRTFPMSAPPSPNILAPKYKPNFTIINQTPSSPHIAPSIPQDVPTAPCYINRESLIVQNLDIQSEHSQPLTADSISQEISQLFADNNLSLDDSNNSLRSQSVPLHQNSVVPENRHIYFNHGQSNSSTMSNMNFLSYNNTPCNSVPPTPVPNEFCDFGTLNDTCESISKVGLNSENLDKIYNVLDSNAEQSLINNVVKQDDILLNPVNSDGIGISNFTQNISNADSMIDPLLASVELPPIISQNGEALSKISFGDQLQYAGQSSMPLSSAGLIKRSNSDEINVSNVPIDSRFYVSRSVPSTPLPTAKISLPSFDVSKTHLISHSRRFQDEYVEQKLLVSKSVPSTPLLTDDRNVFSYSNRDFLINGNSVDPNLSNAFSDKGDGQLEQGYLGEAGAPMEDAASTSVLAGLTMPPLPETIDIVNNELAPFNDDCIDIATENDLLDML
ncbi:uncharacterized protein LOC143917230 [Arctopsyche grandis]|uniref:uncharacterized protein LOC143917230 n=1 Tax=Arctopsyche grandis TaxID=121162 RepID=UPI00406D9B0C